MDYIYISSRAQGRGAVSDTNVSLDILKSEVSFGIYKSLLTIYIYIAELKAEAQYLIQMAAAQEERKVLAQNV